MIGRLQLRHVCLVVLAVLVVPGMQMAVLANPSSGNINVEGTVPAPPPTQAAAITSPTQGQEFSTSPIPVSGTCIGDTTVEIYKNNVFGGSGTCQSGAFSISVDLFIGNNTLLAKIKDSLGQYGPDSVPVEVTYQPIAPSPATPAAGGGSETPVVSADSQLLLLIDADYRGSFPGDWLVIQPSILGGISPYAVKIDWGDGSEEIIARKSNGPFEVGHRYTEPGVKTIKINASDSSGQKAFIQTVAIINGAVEVEESEESIILMSQKNWRWLLPVAGLLSISVSVGAFVVWRWYRRHMKEHHPDSTSN